MPEQPITPAAAVPPFQLDSLPPLDAIEAALERKRQFRILKWFPETGPYRRELYPKHMEFFRMGNIHRERLFLAANRCISPWTPIETPHATRQVLEVVGDSTFDVRSWDGATRCTRQASGVFLKGIEPMFRIHLDNGSIFDATRNHSVLTTDGYRRIGQLIRASSGLHCRQITQDSLANYGVDGRLCGEQPLFASGSGSVRSLSTAGVQTRAHPSSIVDASAQKSRHSRACPLLYRPSIQDDPYRILGLCGQFSDPSILIDDQWNHSDLASLLLFVRESYLNRPSGESLNLCDPILLPFFDGIECHWWSSSRQAGLGSRRSLEPRLSTSSQDHEVEEFLSASACNDLFVSLESPKLAGGARISYIIPIGPQPVLDFTVEGTYNYVIGGVVHHNTGKTVAGALEAALHATGMYDEYAPWWEGKRFDCPTSLWACNKTATDCRDINQLELLGPPGQLGTGMIPASMIIHTKPKPSVPDAIEIAYIKNKFYGQSVIYFKSYDQGREKFQGRAIHVIWADEEVPDDIYTEMLMRTMTTEGIIYLTYTPIQGLTPVTVDFLTNAVNKDTLPLRFTKRDEKALQQILARRQ